MQRRTFSPFTPGHPAIGAILAGLCVAVAVGSIWLTIAAASVLGREWSFQFEEYARRVPAVFPGLR